VAATLKQDANPYAIKSTHAFKLRSHAGLGGDHHHSLPRLVFGGPGVRHRHGRANGNCLRRAGARRRCYRINAADWTFCVARRERFRCSRSDNLPPNVAMYGVTRAPFNSNRSSCGIEVVVPLFSHPKFETPSEVWTYFARGPLQSRNSNRHEPARADARWQCPRRND
jgi:hypothetical protein